MHRFRYPLQPCGRQSSCLKTCCSTQPRRIVLCQQLVEDQRLDAVMKLLSGLLKPHSSMSAAIRSFTHTDSGGTDHVWFYVSLPTVSALTTSALRFSTPPARPHYPSHIQNLDAPNLLSIQPHIPLLINKNGPERFLVGILIPTLWGRGDKFTVMSCKAYSEGPNVMPLFCMNTLLVFP